MSGTQGLQERACPRCGALLALDPTYVAWCDRCNWNLQPYRAERPRTQLAALYAKLGDRLGRSLYNDLLRARSLAPSVTFPLTLALLFALAVHLATLCCAVLGIWLIAHTWFNLLALFGGGALLLLAWVLAPRLPKAPDRWLPRAEFPALYAAADAVAASLRAPRPDMIAITTEFNASYSSVGWRRRHVLRLGLPLLAVLNEEEATALFGHELAHAVNGDATRGFVVGSALYSLGQWQMMLRPGGFNRRMYGQRSIGIAAMLSDLITSALAALAGLGIALLSHLLWRDSQRAEYLADSLAARAAGTEASLSLLDKMHLGDTARSIAQGLAASGGGDFFGVLRQRSAAMPGHEWKRLRAMASLEASRLDATHPPTALRLALLEARPVGGPSVRLTGTQWREVQAEVARLEPATRQALLDQYRARLYS